MIFLPAKRFRGLKDEQGRNERSMIRIEHPSSQNRTQKKSSKTLNGVLRRHERETAG
jgi:hypothetical protein